MIGYLGNLTTAVKNNFSLKGEATAFVLYWSDFIAYVPDKKAYTPVPKFPSVIEDISFVVEDSIPVGPIAKILTSVDPQIISVNLTEKPFVSPKFGVNKKSITFRVEYRNSRKTLTNIDITPLRYKIIQTLKKEYQAQLRK